MSSRTGLMFIIPFAVRVASPTQWRWREVLRPHAKEGAWVVFEASGGYDRVLRDALEAGGVRFSRVNPRQARDFARAMGVIGKTDRVDARMLAELGARLTPAPTRPLPPERRALQA